MEIVVALGLVATVALAIIGVFSTLITASGKSSDQAAAELLAQATLEKAVRSGPPSWGGVTVDRTLQTGDASSGTVYYSQIRTQLLPEAHPLGDLYQVSVLVSWGRSIAKEEAPGRGKLWVERARLVYIDRGGAP